MKTTKHATLLLVKTRGGVRAQDLVRESRYSSATARSYLSHLARQGLLQRMGGGYTLTDKGRARLAFFSVMGCDHAQCPLCEEKLGSFTCPRCGYRLPRDKARLRPARDFLLVWRPAGVHCSLCLSQILTEPQARALGVLEEVP